MSTSSSSRRDESPSIPRGRKHSPLPLLEALRRRRSVSRAASQSSSKSSEPSSPATVIHSPLTSAPLLERRARRREQSRRRLEELDAITQPCPRPNFPPSSRLSSPSTSTSRSASSATDPSLQYLPATTYIPPSPRARMASSSAFPALDTSVPAAGNRSAGTSPTTSSAVNGSNGMNGPSAAAAAAYMAPLPVGHQQDLNHLFNQIQELGSLLRSNRDKVNSITKDAEEVARRANGALTDGEATGSADNDKARIRELELELAKQKHMVELYKHEQRENTKLIGMYEEALGTATEQIRNYCTSIQGRFLAQKKQYNDLLQKEKDDHLQSRLEKDHWFAQTLKVCEMIRTAHRLRSEEWHEEYVVVAALQGEVRCLRRILGMEKQAPEEEQGWPYLKDLPLPD